MNVQKKRVSGINDNILSPPKPGRTIKASAHNAPKEEHDLFAKMLKSISSSLEIIIKNDPVGSGGVQWYLLADLKEAMKDKPSLMTKKNIRFIRLFFHNWALKLLRSTDDDKKKYNALFCQTDINVLFPFIGTTSIIEKIGITTQEELQQRYQDCIRHLNKLCPHRQAVIQELVTSVFLRLLGISDVTFPLLIGGPGTGKTVIARKLQAALNAVGIRTEFVFQSMTESNSKENGNQSEMKLLGTDEHWGNAKPGKIFYACENREVDLCLVLLDEAEKHDKCEELMINLLDPVQPLQDTFISGTWDKMDMRHKVIFLLSANDDTTLNKGSDDPLWSRLTPIYFQPYTENELVDLLTTLAERAYTGISLYSLDKKECRAIAGRLVKHHGTGLSFRVYLNQINRTLAENILGLPAADNKITRMPGSRRQRIGF